MSKRFETYTDLRDFLDGYTSPDGVIQGDPATIAAEAVGAGYVAADENHAVQFEAEPMTNDEIIEAVQNYCAELHAAHVEREEQYGRVDWQKAWTGEDAKHVAGLLNQASGEFDPWSLFRFMDEQTGSWRVGYRTKDGREWFHILRQMRNTREGGLFETLGK